MDVRLVQLACDQAARYGAQVGYAVWHGNAFIDIYDAYRHFRNQFVEVEGFDLWAIEESFDYGWDNFKEIQLVRK